MNHFHISCIMHIRPCVMRIIAFDNKKKDLPCKFVKACIALLRCREGNYIFRARENGGGGM